MFSICSKVNISLITEHFALSLYLSVRHRYSFPSARLHPTDNIQLTHMAHVVKLLFGKEGKTSFEVHELGLALGSDSQELILNS